MSDRSIIGWFSARSETDQLVRRVLDFVVDILGMRSSYSQVEVNRCVAWMYYWQLATVTADQKRTEDKYLENEGNLTSTYFGLTPVYKSIPLRCWCNGTRTQVQSNGPAVLWPGLDMTVHVNPVNDNFTATVPNCWCSQAEEMTWNIGQKNPWFFFFLSHPTNGKKSLEIDLQG